MTMISSATLVSSILAFVSMTSMLDSMVLAEGVPRSLTTGSVTTLADLPHHVETEFRNENRIKDDCNPSVQQISAKTFQLENDSDPRTISFDDTELIPVTDVLSERFRLIVDNKVEEATTTHNLFRIKDHSNIMVFVNDDGTMKWAAEMSETSTGAITSTMILCVWYGSMYATITDECLQEVSIEGDSDVEMEPPRFLRRHNSIQTPSLPNMKKRKTTNKLWPEWMVSSTTPRDNFSDDARLPQNLSTERQLSGACTVEYTVELEIVIDSTMCARFGGSQAAVDEAAAIIAFANVLYHPLCIKFDILDCYVYCDAALDPIQQLLADSNGVCGGGSSVIDEFRLFVRNGIPFEGTNVISNADLVHLFYHFDVQGAGTTIGCAYVGAACVGNGFKVGVNNMNGLNPGQRGFLFAHEAGHNLNARHNEDSDTDVMRPNLCRDGCTFEDPSDQVIMDYVQTASCVQAVPCTGSPTESPTSPPTQTPTGIPTESPTETPTSSPTQLPTTQPTRTPTTSPTAAPTGTPTDTPTGSPTQTPTTLPTQTPTESPTETPTRHPTSTPTNSPTGTPTVTPTKTPSTTPTGSPTITPTAQPTSMPTTSPTAPPTGTPTETPTGSPTQTPTTVPTQTPTESPTETPTGHPTSTPTNSPTGTPTGTSHQQRTLVQRLQDLQR